MVAFWGLKELSFRCHSKHTYGFVGQGLYSCSVRGIFMGRCRELSFRYPISKDLAFLMMVTTQRAQYPLNKKYTFNYRGLNIII